MRNGLARLQVAKELMRKVLARAKVRWGAQRAWVAKRLARVRAGSAVADWQKPAERRRQIKLEV